MPKALMPGVMETVFDALTATADTKSAGYAVPRAPSGAARTISWSTKFSDAPSGASYALQGAMHDVEAEYADLSTSTSTAGETKVVTNVTLPFVRLRQVSRTGAISVTGTLYLG